MHSYFVFLALGGAAKCKWGTGGRRHSGVGSGVGEAFRRIRTNLKRKIYEAMKMFLSDSSVQGYDLFILFSFVTKTFP